MGHSTAPATVWVAHSDLNKSVYLNLKHHLIVSYSKAQKTIVFLHYKIYGTCLWSQCSNQVTHLQLPLQSGLVNEKLMGANWNRYSVSLPTCTYSKSGVWWTNPPQPASLCKLLWYILTSKDCMRVQNNIWFIWQLLLLTQMPKRALCIGVTQRGSERAGLVWWAEAVVIGCQGMRLCFT